MQVQLQRHFCYACGDPADTSFHGRPVCVACANELRFGKVPWGSVEFFFTRAAESRPSDRRYNGQTWGEVLYRTLQHARDESDDDSAELE